ncbi:MAG: 50S ribosomal protein L35 [Deltaproteobacteria bacterium]|nr:50S ribosomal protein L35 [Deltaproteobacteria bacterium]
MPKLKTKKAAAKRFRVKPSGKIKFDRANHEHLATKKSRKRKNKLKKAKYVGHSDLERVMRVLPTK